MLFQHWAYVANDMGGRSAWAVSYPENEVVFIYEEGFGLGWEEGGMNYFKERRLAFGRGLFFFLGKSVFNAYN